MEETKAEAIKEINNNNQLMKQNTALLVMDMQESILLNLSTAGEVIKGARAIGWAP